MCVATLSSNKMRVLATQLERVALNVQNGAVNLRGERSRFSWCLSCSSSVWHRPAVRGDGSAVPGLCQSLQRTCSAWQWGRRRQRHGLHCSTLQHSHNKDGLGKHDLCCCCVLTTVWRRGPETASVRNLSSCNCQSLSQRLCN